MMTRDCNETFQNMLSNKNIAMEYEILIGNSGDCSVLECSWKFDVKPFHLWHSALRGGEMSFHWNVETATWGLIEMCEYTLVGGRQMWCMASRAHVGLNTLVWWGAAQAWVGNGWRVGEKAPNCWGIARWGHKEDFLPIPWLPIHPYSLGGGRQGQDGGVRTQPPCHTNPGLSKWPSYLRLRPDPCLGWAGI